MTDNDGGPAFPRPLPSMRIGPGEMHEAERLMNASAGMTLRDYFIAHAPAEPQPWFQPVMPEPCPPARFLRNDGRREWPSATAADREVGEDGWHNPNDDAIKAWRDERAKQRLVQWPAAWADEQIKLRSAR